MQQFNLDKWLKNKSRKVVTRDGRPARILCTDAKAKDGCCIIAAIETDDEEEGYQFYKDGKVYSSKSSIEDCTDLFFADEEELTEFEKELNRIVTAFSATHAYMDETEIHHYSKGLLDLAKKELERDSGPKCISTDIEQDMFDNMTNLQKCFVKMFKYADYHGMVNAIKQFSGLAEALIKKYFPKWKKVDSNPPKVQYNLQGKRLYKDGEYYIELSDLETLPKEE